VQYFLPVIDSNITYIVKKVDFANCVTPFRIGYAAMLKQ